MDGKNAHTAVNLLDGEPTTVPGQVVLPEMQDALGYEAAVLEGWQERFCWEYVLNGDVGYKAYLAVKPRVKESTARVESSKLLTLPNIIDRIAAIRKENLRRWEVTADDLRDYHGKVMKIDRRKFFKKEGGRVTHIELVDLDDDLASIVDIETVQGKFGVKLIPVVAARQKSADALARMMGLDKSKVELTGKDGKPIESITATANTSERFQALREKLAAFKPNADTAA